MFTLVCALWLGSDAGPTESLAVTAKSLEDRVRVEVNGELFTEIRFGGDSKTFLYPILGPGQTHLTRRWPEESVDGEEHDHPHHRGLWFAHGAVNGHDFWTGENGASRITNAEVVAIETKDGIAVVKTRSAWLHGEEKLLRDEREYTFRATPEERYLDLAITLTAEKDIAFGDTKEGTMALRIAETLRLKGEHATGRARNSEGIDGAAIWGKRARFVDYSGKIGDTSYGVAAFDDPMSFRHPTWWHARDYGLLAANPFGVHDFENKPEGSGNEKLLEGKSLSFRYRFVFYRGTRSLEDLEAWEPRPANGK